MRGLFGEGCDTRPMPSLLAEPSRPRAIITSEIENVRSGYLQVEDYWNEEVEVKLSPRLKCLA